MPWKVGQNGNHLECSVTKLPTVSLGLVAQQKIRILMDFYLQSEWAAYLVGKEDEKQVYIEDIQVPPHDYANGVSAEIAEPKYNKDTGQYDMYVPENCVGFVHSHNSMGAFHSSVDDQHVDRNYPVSITVAKKQGNIELEYDTICCKKTECGRYLMNGVSITFEQVKPNFDTKAWLNEARTNIESGMKKCTQDPFQKRINMVARQQELYEEQARKKTSSSDAYIPARYRLYQEAFEKAGLEYPFDD